MAIISASTDSGQKQTCFEEAARVPFIIAAPGVTAAGEASPRPVELVDLYPTLADLAGLARPTSKGPACVPCWMIRVRPGPAPPLLRPSAAPSGQSVRTERWRYTEWDGGAGAELYDHEQDPQELHNLAAEPGQARIVEQMQALLRQAHPTEVKGGTAQLDTKQKFCR